LGRDFAEKLPLIDFHLKSKHINDSLFLFPTDETEIKSLINGLKKGKAPGRDGITTEILQNTSEYISAPLAWLINRCFDDGVFPSIFAKSVITPLYKGGDRCEIINYRPLSLTSTISKIVERVIKIRLLSFISKHKIISANQFGFKEKCSTSDAIADLMSNIYGGLDVGDRVLCVFADLAKAFDTVHHRKLLNKLEHCGVRGRALQLFEQYIAKRSQCVKIGDVYSAYTEIRYGVPQGTVLGPILFDLYVNDLLEMKTSGTIIAFADDTAILYKSKQGEKLFKEEIETDLSNISKWFIYNKLTLNTDKTKFISFSPSIHNNCDFNTLEIKITNDEILKIHKTRVIKYLGIYLDENNRWNTHIEKTCNKLRNLLFKFKIMKEYLPIKSLKMVYFSLVESIISYGIIGWGGTAKTILKPLAILQKRILKIILGKPLTYPTELLYKEGGVLDVRKLFSKAAIEYGFQKNLFTKADHSYFTRNTVAEKVALPRANKTVGQRTYRYWAPRLYNILPQELRQPMTKIKFKKKLRNWLLNNDLPMELVL